MAEETKKELTPEARRDALNDELHNKVIFGVTKANNGFIDSVNKARKNPSSQSIDPKIFDLMIEANNNHLKTLIDDAYESSKFELQTTKDGKVIPKQKPLIFENNAEDLEKFKKAVKEETIRLGMAGLTTEKEKTEFNRDLNAAYEAVNREVPRNGGGLLDTVTKPYFNEEKGGLQWGGILGAALGMFAGMWMGGGVEGGLLGIAVMVLGIAAGTWGGNFLSDAYNAKKEAESQEQGKGKAREQSKPTPERERSQGTEEPSKKKEEKKTGKGDGDSQEPPKDKKAKEQADKLKAPDGVTITPPDASSIPTNAVGDVAQLSSTRVR